MASADDGAADGSANASPGASYAAARDLFRALAGMAPQFNAPAKPERSSDGAAADLPLASKSGAGNTGTPPSDADADADADAVAAGGKGGGGEEEDGDGVASGREAARTEHPSPQRAAPLLAIDLASISLLPAGEGLHRIAALEAVRFHARETVAAALESLGQDASPIDVALHSIAVLEGQRDADAGALDAAGVGAAQSRDSGAGLVLA